MGKKVRFSKKQMQYINEMTLDGDNALGMSNGNTKTAAQNVIDDAQKNGVNVNNGVDVSFSADALRKNCGISESITGKQLKQMRVQYLKEHSVQLSKKDLLR